MGPGSQRQTLWEGLAVGILGHDYVADFFREEHYRPQCLGIVLGFNLIESMD